MKEEQLELDLDWSGYKVIACDSACKLEEEVNHYLARGYKLVGGLAAHLTLTAGTFLLQAVAKRS
jgi:hypothetical protein